MEPESKWQRSGWAYAVIAAAQLSKPLEEALESVAVSEIRLAAHLELVGISTLDGPWTRASRLWFKVAALLWLEQQEDFTAQWSLWKMAAKLYLPSRIRCRKPQRRLWKPEFLRQAPARTGASNERPTGARQSVVRLSVSHRRVSTVRSTAVGARKGLRAGVG